jgi:hypothetical protein
MRRRHDVLINRVEDVEKHIRENWFKNHKATLTQHGDLQVLEWREPGTIFYYVRYVFDGNKVYISGDIGEAIYWLTWKADVHSFKNIHIDYFTEKLQAYHDNRWDFSSEKAVRRLREWLKELKDRGKKYDHDEMKELFEKARGCSSADEWAYIVNETGFISEFEPDYWEWFYKIGNDYPWRMRGYLIGLQMASEQLKVIEAAKTA